VAFYGCCASDHGAPPKAAIGAGARADQASLSGLAATCGKPWPLTEQTL